jgi:hypothetical protein
MNVSIQIKNGDNDLLACGVFLVKWSLPTNLEVNVDNEHLTLIFKFENNETDSQIKKEAKEINSTTLEIVFTNYNNSLGNYTKDLWEIGNIKNRKLFLSYVITGLPEGNLKQVDYTLYLGEGVTNG